MTLEEFARTPHGLYIVNWKHGGSSVAAIGSDASGDRWLAPTNWMYPTMCHNPGYRRSIENIDRLTRVLCNELMTP